MFQWIFHKSELLTTFDEQRYRQVKERLAGAGIPFRTKWKDNASRHSAGRFGTFGEMPGFRIQYYIYVLAEDLERAAEFLR